MIYEVRTVCPAAVAEGDVPVINEVCTTSADSEQQAIERCVYSAVQRMVKEGRTPEILVAYIEAGATEEEQWQRVGKGLLALIATGEATVTVVEAPAGTVPSC